MQWEIHRLQTERNYLSTEMSNLTVELDKVDINSFDCETLTDFQKFL